jgi:hypothetical protein
MISTPQIEQSRDTAVLSQGQTKVDDFKMLNGAYDMTLPGNYAIIGSRDLPSDIDPNARITVFSNTIIIKVRPYGDRPND